MERLSSKVEIILFIFLLSACGHDQQSLATLSDENKIASVVSSTLTSIPSSTPIPIPTNTSITTPSYPETWMKLTSDELNLSFQFPPLPGKIYYEYSEFPKEGMGYSGTLVEWVVKLDDHTWTYAFAGCASNDLKIGRSVWETEVSSLIFNESDQRYYLEIRTGFTKLIEPLRIITRSDGRQGLIYRAGISKNDDGIAKSAIINLPEGQHKKINCISFYFADNISLDDIENVIQSVTFNK